MLHSDCCSSFNQKLGSLWGHRVHRDICLADTKWPSHPPAVWSVRCIWQEKLQRLWPAVLSTLRLIHLVIELLMTSFGSQPVTVTLYVSVMMDDSSLFTQSSCCQCVKQAVPLHLKTLWPAVVILRFGEFYFLSWNLEQNSDTASSVVPLCLLVDCIDYYGPWILCWFSLIALMKLFFQLDIFLRRWWRVKQSKKDNKLDLQVIRNKAPNLGSAWLS